MRVNDTYRVHLSSMQTAVERKQSRGVAAKGAFAEALRQANVTFSKHAEQRLLAWKEAETEGLIGELNSAMDLAQAKGARSTLVLMKGVAFVVAPQSRTVVTVIPEERMKHNLFTSIDSAVLVDK
ncbi:MAG: flagellar biosynthesis protein [Bacillota bacterium]|jgi:flagellar operon protein|nr:flagellar biosynthesis protein [Candidatus Fermentithermobacillaceae bacterium]